MKYIVLIYLFFFVSCYTSKNAENDIEKAHRKYPELVAKKTSEYFPSGWQVMKMDEKDKRIADSLFGELNGRVIILSDTIEKLIKQTDTIIDCSGIDRIRQQLIQSKKIIDGLKIQLQKPTPVIYRSIKIQDSARIYYLDSELNNAKKSELRYRDKYEQLLKISIWLIIALGISLFFNFYKK
jgi:hypothetical protein